jgi:hypothetical protein
MLILNRVVRWVARFLSAAVAAIVLTMLVGETAQDGWPVMTGTEAVMGVLFLVVWSGLIVGWFRERVGSAMIVLGLAGFYLTNYAASGRFPSGFFFLVMLLPGALYLISDVLARRR